MAAMEIRMPFGLIGSFAPCRAGGFVGNQRFHSSFIPAKSDSSRRMNVAWTTSSIVDPAAFRIASTFRALPRLFLDRLPDKLSGRWIERAWPDTNTTPSPDAWL